MPNFNYPADADERIFRSGIVRLGDQRVHLSACTVQGNAGPGLPYPNEDAFSITTGDRLVAGVFDGATSLRLLDWLDDQTGARYASHLLKDRLAKLALDTPPSDLLARLNSILLEGARGRGSDLRDVHALPSSTATIVTLEAGASELHLSHISDSFAVAYYEDGTSRLLTPVHETYDTEMRRLMAKIAQDQGITPRQARNDPRIIELLLAKRQERHNAPDGHGDGVLNGDPAAALYFRYRRIPLAGITSILIASDGLFPQGVSERSAEGRDTVLKLLNSGGLPAVIEAKQASEDSDPDWHSLRYKHSDDATAVWIKFR
jgi:hypothetical protein